MKKLTRLFLLCLMMIAIPIQGIAASGMMNCCCAKHQSANSTEESKPALDKPAYDIVSHAAHDDGNDDSAAEKKCGSCANCCCCCGSASSCGTPASNSSSEKVRSLFSSQKGHVSDGLERPPRN